MISILSQIRPISHIDSISLSLILLVSSNVRLDAPIQLFSCSLTCQYFEKDLLSCPIFSACPVKFFHLHLMKLFIVNFVHIPFSSILGPDILHRISLSISRLNGSPIIYVLRQSIHFLAFIIYLLFALFI